MLKRREKGITSCRPLLEGWLKGCLTSGGLKRLTKRVKSISEAETSGLLAFMYLRAISAALRDFKGETITITDEQCALALGGACSFDPVTWSFMETARGLYTLSLPLDDREIFTSLMKAAFTTASAEELVSLYRILPALPYGDSFIVRAQEGIRSNIPDVFNSVIVGNTYPSIYFDEMAWNQMVLKALYYGTPVKGIIGYEERFNEGLVEMVKDYVRERRSAERDINKDALLIISKESNSSESHDYEI